VHPVVSALVAAAGKRPAHSGEFVLDDAIPSGGSGPTLDQEPQADTVVLPPGAVILPIAIYK